MSGMERIYQIDLILAGRKFVPRQELKERLGVSWATLKRYLAYLKDHLNAPITFDRERFPAKKIHALQAMKHSLSNLDTLAVDEHGR